MDVRHQSSAIGIIMLGEDIHPWYATKGGNPKPATISEATNNKKTNKLLIPATIPDDR